MADSKGILKGALPGRRDVGICSCCGHLGNDKSGGVICHPRAVHRCGSPRFTNRELFPAYCGCFLISLRCSVLILGRPLYMMRCVPSKFAGGVVGRCGPGLGDCVFCHGFVVSCPGTALSRHCHFTVRCITRYVLTEGGR